MNFCINIEDPLKSICYRLQQDETWQPCSNTKIISANDFVTTDKVVVLKLQQQDKKITINNREYTVNTTSGINVMAFEDLSYVIYGYRDDYPDDPTRQQLESTLINGDDTKDNKLILKTDGLFYLVDPRTILFNKSDPTIVYKFEGFNAGNGYVGSTIVNNNFVNYINEYYKSGLKYWNSHKIERSSIFKVCKYRIVCFNLFQSSVA